MTSYCYQSFFKQRLQTTHDWNAGQQKIQNSFLIEKRGQGKIHFIIIYWGYPPPTNSETIICLFLWRAPYKPSLSTVGGPGIPPNCIAIYVKRSWIVSNPSSFPQAYNAEKNMCPIVWRSSGLQVPIQSTLTFHAESVGFLVGSCTPRKMVKLSVLFDFFGVCVCVYPFTLAALFKLFVFQGDSSTSVIWTPVNITFIKRSSCLKVRWSCNIDFPIMFIWFETIKWS